MQTSFVPPLAQLVRQLRHDSAIRYSTLLRTAIIKRWSKSLWNLDAATDQLLGQPLLVREPAEKYNKRTKPTLGVEKLVQELIRLRKQGKLPKLKRQ